MIIAAFTPKERDQGRQVTDAGEHGDQHDHQ